MAEQIKDDDDGKRQGEVKETGNTVDEAML